MLASNHLMSFRPTYHCWESCWGDGIFFFHSRQGIKTRILDLYLFIQRALLVVVVGVPAEANGKARTTLLFFIRL